MITSDSGSPMHLPTRNFILDEKEMEQLYGPLINDTISPNDAMFAGDKLHYLRVAYSSLRCINLSLLAARKDIPTHIFDFPCGHGRELRLLKQAFPQSQFTVSDIDRDAVDFCAANFGAKAVYSARNPEQIALTSTFDLIWCGSLLTHLSADRWPSFFKFFYERLNPGGLAVFSTHGLVTEDWLTSPGHYHYCLQPGATRQILSGYYATEFGYADYQEGSDYGISLSTTGWVSKQIAQIPGWRLVAYFPRAWDDHQDVWACQRF